eukprot:TRINITY_DN122_c0_g1_i2.p1 TRINITY_DN122_c0_g1~~TRINITY_DN122_c0_g1_i2.p1  ORF type:complete len:211 (-),score=46.83 TRINITY_DN122_c0_g1_i2:1991-2623(-)
MPRFAAVNHTSDDPILKTDIRTVCADYPSLRLRSFHQPIVQTTDSKGFVCATHLDAKMSEHDSGSSGASNTIPVQAGALKKGAHVVIKGFPCKIVDYSTSKTGKHGHAKANIVGVDIFTGKKYEDISPSSHNMMSPIVTRKDYQLIDVDEEGFVTLMDDKHETRSDLRLDVDGEEVHKKCKDDFDEGKDLIVTVLSALGIEKVIAVKELQ